MGSKSSKSSSKSPSKEQSESKTETKNETKEIPTTKPKFITVFTDQLIDNDKLFKTYGTLIFNDAENQILGIKFLDGVMIFDKLYRLKYSDGGLYDTSHVLLKMPGYWLPDYVETKYKYTIKNHIDIRNMKDAALQLQIVRSTWPDYLVALIKQDDKFCTTPTILIISVTGTPGIRTDNLDRIIENLSFCPVEGLYKHCSYNINVHNLTDLLIKTPDNKLEDNKDNKDEKEKDNKLDDNKDNKITDNDDDKHENDNTDNKLVDNKDNKDNKEEKDNKSADNKDNKEEKYEKDNKEEKYEKDDKEEKYEKDDKEEKYEKDDKEEKYEKDDKEKDDKEKDDKKIGEVNIFFCKTKY